MRIFLHHLVSELGFRIEGRGFRGLLHHLPWFRLFEHQVRVQGNVPAQFALLRSHIHTHHRKIISGAHFFAKEIHENICGMLPSSNFPRAEEHPYPQPANPLVRVRRSRKMYLPPDWRLSEVVHAPIFQHKPSFIPRAHPGALLSDPVYTNEKLSGRQNIPGSRTKFVTRWLSPPLSLSSLRKPLKGSPLSPALLFLTFLFVFRQTIICFLRPCVSPSHPHDLSPPEVFSHKCLPSNPGNLLFPLSFSLRPSNQCRMYSIPSHQIIIISCI